MSCGCISLGWENNAHSPQARSNALDIMSNFPPLEHRADFAALCPNIFKSVEYGLQDDMLDQGPKCVAASLRVASETLRYDLQYKQEIVWAERAQEMVQNRSLRLLRYYIPRRQSRISTSGSVHSSFAKDSLASEHLHDCSPFLLSNNFQLTAFLCCFPPY